MKNQNLLFLADLEQNPSNIYVSFVLCNKSVLDKNEQINIDVKSMLYHVPFKVSHITVLWVRTKN